jgi:hypothetical protein
VWTLTGHARARRLELPEALWVAIDRRVEVSEVVVSAVITVTR